ncbi:hypothetical protein L917_08816 [Phytophthora nicotianae]|uniref:SWIM-type domain-containing protein n=1 Tax=Phytophthora nicotianae TaxID=4792 RepID=W2L6E3_PHYNI|nr:hypothetical protein L917_08816 [Phytophthora nicotianae]
MGEYASHEAGKGVSPGLHPDDVQSPKGATRSATEPGDMRLSTRWSCSVNPAASRRVYGSPATYPQTLPPVLQLVMARRTRSHDTVDADNKHNEGPVPGQDEVEPVPEPGERDVSEAGSRAGSDDSVAARAEHPDNSYITGGAPKRIFNAEGEGDRAVGSKVHRKLEPLRLYSPHVADRSTSSCEEEETVAPHEDDEKGASQEDEEKGTSHKDSDDEDLPFYLQFLEEKKPRERGSKTTAEREAMIAAHVNVNNHYIKNGGGGKRNASVNFTGCPARFDLELTNVALPGCCCTTVAALHDCNASSDKIAGYMSEELGLPNYYLSGSKKFYKEEEDCEAMVIHDQMGVRCTIVVQNATQKLAFKNWGETPAMDWTHGTNNVGKNASWMKTKTFVIDKHFVEWRVLEECFPTAKVLLCQFHAIMYWKKLVSNRFGLVLAEQDTVQHYFAKMLYSTSLSAFERTYKQFCSFCAGRYPNVRSYFDKNWKECREMWSNHLRNKYFSAGNTTTNRIESNWHLLKQLLGKKTSVDQTVASVLTHQAAITRQVLQSLHRHNCSSRNPDSVPVYLRRTAGVLSDYVLAKVRQQWDLFMVAMKDGSIERSQDNQWMWDVTSNGKTYPCNDIEWTCTCPFWTSLMLPCQHLMYVCRYGHGFEELPIVTISYRWSMAEATKLFRQLEKDKASDPSDTDEDNDVDITNYYDTVQLMEEMEKRQYEEEKEEEYICPPTQPSTVLCDVNTVGDVTRASDVNRDSCQ